jgi:hypothetical protein
MPHCAESQTLGKLASAERLYMSSVWLLAKVVFAECHFSVRVTLDKIFFVECLRFCIRQSFEHSAKNTFSIVIGI